MSDATQDLKYFKGDNLSVKMFGAVSDGVVGAGTISSGSHNFLATTGAFTLDSVGKLIAVALAGASSVTLITTIATFVDSTHVTLTAAAGHSVTASPAVWGTDNTTAIQSALQNPSTLTTRRVQFPPDDGVYLTKTISPVTNSILEGGGWIDIIDDSTTTGNSIFIDGKSNVTIQNLKITSTSAGARTGVYGNIRIQGSDGVTVKSCVIQGSSSTGIHVLNGTNLLFDGNSISETWADGIHISRGSSRARVTNNHINHVGDDGIGLIGYISDGVTDYPAMQGMVVTGNNIYNLTKGVGRGISAYGVQDGVITDNVVDTIYDVGILVGAVLGSDPTQATHCSYKLVIANNKTRNVGLGGVECGIFVSYARSVKVIGNEVDESPGDGISLSFVCPDSEVSHNTVARVLGRGIICEQISSTDSRLIQELYTDVGDTTPSRATTTHVNISDNSVRNVGANGIICQGEDTHHMLYMSVARNHIYLTVTDTDLSSGDAILVRWCDNSTLLGNIVPSPRFGAIKCSGCNYSSLTGNSAVNCGDYGIAAVQSNFTIMASGNIATGGAVGFYSDPGCQHSVITGNIATGNSTADVFVDQATYKNSIQFNNFTADYIATAQGGSGAPEGVYTAPIGGLYLGQDGGGNSTLYVKTSGSGSSGWMSALLADTAALTTSSPLKVDSGKNLTTGKIGLTSTNDVTLGSITAGHILKRDNSTDKVADGGIGGPVFGAGVADNDIMKADVTNNQLKTATAADICAAIGMSVGHTHTYTAPATHVHGGVTAGIVNTSGATGGSTDTTSGPS